MTPQEPQSIIHQVVRLERKLVRAVSMVHRRRRASNRKATRDMSCKTDGGSTYDESSERTFSDSSLFFNQSDSQSLHMDKKRCPTITEKQFLDEIMIGHEKGQVSYVHFFINDSRRSDGIDGLTTKLQMLYPQSRFLRMDLLSSPMILSKLKLGESKEPFIVAMLNGKVLNKMNDFSSDQCSELGTWVSTVQTLKKLTSQ